MKNQISALTQAAKEADEYLPGHRKEHIRRYIAALHPETVDELIEQLEAVSPHVRSAMVTKAIRANEVLPS